MNKTLEEVMRELQVIESDERYLSSGNTLNRRTT